MLHRPRPRPRGLYFTPRSPVGASPRPAPRTNSLRPGATFASNQYKNLTEHLKFRPTLFLS